MNEVIYGKVRGEEWRKMVWSCLFGLLEQQEEEEVEHGTCGMVLVAWSLWPWRGFGPGMRGWPLTLPRPLWAV